MDTSDPLNSFSQLVGSIYQGALEDPPWQRQLAELRDALGASDAFLILRRPSDAGLGLTIGADESVAQWTQAPYFAQRLYLLDPFVNLPPNQPTLLSELLADAAEPDDAFIRLVLEPYDIAHILGVDLHDPSGPSASLRLTRGSAYAPFGAEQKQLCALHISPYTTRAHLRSIFSKLGIARQPQLVHLVHKSLASLG